MAERSSGIPVKRKVSNNGNQSSSPNSGARSKAPPSPLPKCPGSPQAAAPPVTPQPQVTMDKVAGAGKTKTHHDGTIQGVQGSGDGPVQGNNTESPGEHLETVSSLVPQRGQSLLYYSLLLVLTAVSLATRLYNIELPAHVCWDEVHFGKMGSWYIQGTFFFDVHPPLGKMLVGLSGYLSGYDGMFPFDKPGDEYKEVQYVGMRVFCGVLGAALVPLVYMSTWLLCHSPTAALFAASFVIFDTGTLTLSRYILLDPYLMFFIMCSVYCLLKFLSYRQRSFSVFWWFWLVWTGVFLACSIGVKFVGLFIILLAGYTTIVDLWRLLGEHSLPMVSIWVHFIARAFSLITIPLLCYMLFFAAHFKFLTKSGPGDGFYSSQFQSQLEGNRLHNISMPDSVAYGSVISLKQRRTGGAYLHSHWHLYPEEAGPRQQQVTSYSHKDENNMWRFKPATEEPDTDTMPVYVRNGDLVRLEHVATKRNMHSHKEPAPVTQRHFQVSGYGQDGIGDANDVWVVEVPGVAEGEPLKAVQMKMRLIHYHVRCALYSHEKKLPKWGWDQLEVTCNPNVKDSKAMWSVEEVRDPRLPNVSFEVHGPSFLEKFLESHAVMTQGNSGLKPKEGEVTSRPWQWPLNIRGQMFSGKNHRIYLLGNPMIFWASLGCIGLFLGLYTLHAVRRQRGVKITPQLNAYCEEMFAACWWLLIGWSLHYLPFWPMTRVLYFHHYFPAFLFSAMLSGVILDYTIKRLCLLMPSMLSVTMFHCGVGLILSVTSYSFYLFHPLTYGMSGPFSNEETGMMHGLKWLESWEF